MLCHGTITDNRSCNDIAIAIAIITQHTYLSCNTDATVTSDIVGIVVAVGYRWFDGNGYCRRVTLTIAVRYQIENSIRATGASASYLIVALSPCNVGAQ